MQQRLGSALLLLVAALVLSCACMFAGRDVQAAQKPLSAASADEACVRCHAAIVESYSKTTMANGSGTAAAALLPGSFTDSSSGVAYRVALQHGTPTMGYQRPATDPRGELSGSQLMEFFVGSGRRGRTYLYQQEGLWFELPINYYTRRAAWDLSPNYDHLQNMPPALPVDPNCLHCHASDIAPSLPAARNAFAGAPFARGGVTCSACHGNGSAHVAAGGHAPIVNPDRLSPVRRDSACIQCHLEGDAVVFRAGKSLANFQPGDNLQDTAAYFVRASRSAGGERASSQYEAMLQSACKQGSGDRMTCTTCHDPHSTPAPAERVAFYRARCLACHAAPTFQAAAHHPQQQDCAACHMPSRATSDISHEQVTDHNIQRVPARPAAKSPLHTGELLVGVPGFGAGNRELGLAYTQMAQRGDTAAGARALALLKPLETGADEQLAVNLAYLLQASGSMAEARAGYQHVLEAQPAEGTALGNLAVLEASQGRLRPATELLRKAFANNPAQSTTALNLALLLCHDHQPEEAKAVVLRAQRFNPDVPALRRLQRDGCPR